MECTTYNRDGNDEEESFTAFCAEDDYVDGDEEIDNIAECIYKAVMQIVNAKVGIIKGTLLLRLLQLLRVQVEEVEFVKRSD